MIVAGARHSNRWPPAYDAAMGPSVPILQAVLAVRPEPSEEPTRVIVAPPSVPTTAGSTVKEPSSTSSTYANTPLRPSDPCTATDPRNGPGGASTMTTAEDTTCDGAIAPPNSMNEEASAVSSLPMTYTGDPPPSGPAKGNTAATSGSGGSSSSAFLTLGSSYASDTSPVPWTSPNPDATVTTAAPSSRAGATHSTVPASTEDAGMGPIVPTLQ